MTSRLRILRRDQLPGSSVVPQRSRTPPGPCGRHTPTVRPSSGPSIRLTGDPSGAQYFLWAYNRRSAGDFTCPALPRQIVIHDLLQLLTRWRPLAPSRHGSPRPGRPRHLTAGRPRHGRPCPSVDRPLAGQPELLAGRRSTIHETLGQGTLARAPCPDQTANDGRPWTGCAS
jgi:hypothetical protein